MLTGDNEHSAYAVANEVGIDKVHAKLLPEDKLKNYLHLDKNMVMYFLSAMV